MANIGVWEIWNFTPYTVNDLYADLRANDLRYVHSRTPVMVPGNEGEEGVYYWEQNDRIPYSGRWWYLYWPENWNFDRIAEKYLAKPSSMDDAIAFAFERQMLLDLEATKGANLKGAYLEGARIDNFTQLSNSQKELFG